MKKVLIADDVSGWRDFNTRVVSSIINGEIQIDTCKSAGEAYNKILENNDYPYDVVITDLQMEDDYAPKHAGEWLIEQIKMLPNYYKCKIIMISASGSIRLIAENLGVDFIPKSTAIKCISAYEELLIN